MNGDGGKKMKVNKVEKIDSFKEFKKCPACGYEDGFHSMFRKEDGKTRWLLICPECHQVFDIGLDA